MNPAVLGSGPGGVSALAQQSSAAQQMPSAAARARAMALKRDEWRSTAREGDAARARV
jgi:hypothetical protein